MVEVVDGVESMFSQSGAPLDGKPTMHGGKRRRRGKSKSRRTRRRMRGGAAGPGPETPMKVEGNSEFMGGGKSRRKRRKGRKGKKSRSSRR